MKRTGRDHDGRVIILPPTTAEEHIAAKPEDEDINLKFLRALPSSWSQVALTLKTKGRLKLLSFDDLYYKLKTFEVDVKGYTTFSSSQSAGPSHYAFVSATKKMSYEDSLSYSSTTAYSVSLNSKTGSHRSGNVIEDVLQSFVADTEPEQQLAYEDFEQIEKLDLEEMDLKWQMAMLSVRVHTFEQKARRKIDFDKKESAMFNKKKGYSSFKIKEIGKKEEDSKALITVDTLVDWTYHDGESNGVITSKEFGMIDGCDTEDVIKEGAAKIYNLITGADTEEASTAVQAYKNSLKTLEKPKRVLQRNQLTLEDKIRVLSIELKNTSILLKHSERTNADVETAKKDLQTKLDNHLVQTEKWRNSSKNMFRLIDSSMSVRTKVGLGFNNRIRENELGWDDSSFSVFTTNSEDVEGRPLFNRFAKTDSMKAVPLPLSGDYTSLSYHIDMDESHMSYVTSLQRSTLMTLPPVILVSNLHSSSQTILPPVHQFPVGTHLIKDCDFYEKQMSNKTVGIGVGLVHCRNKFLLVNERYLHQFLLVGKIGLFSVPTDRGYSPSENPFSDAEVEEIFDSGCSRSMNGNKERLDDFQVIQGGKVTFGGGEDTECLVLSKDFKLLDESMVVLRVPRKHNLYTINLNNLCPRGKQHKASYKAINAVSSITEPLQLLHMDLFGPASIRIIDHKYYYLVITDDYNRIKKEYSNARTPQQNGVAERKNRTLIEAARTMLADSKLPTMFWTEAVRTACYVLNRVLVTSPHNKTPYALLTGNIPCVSYFKPFGCHATILNTSDHLGKFDGKADEGYIVGYFASYKHDKANQSAGAQDTTTNPAGTEPKDTSGDEFDDSSLNSTEYIFQKELARLKAVQTRSKVKTTTAVKPRSVAQAFEDPSWVDAMQEEMQQFKFQNVWVLVDLPKGKYAIGTKWILKNKRDSNGIIMDVKSAFLYGRIDEEVYVTQPKGFVDPQHHKKAWCDEFEALMKGEFQMSAIGELTFFLGLQVQQRPDGIFINQDKYMKDILNKFDLGSVRMATTPYEAPKPKSKNESDSPVNPNGSSRWISVFQVLYMDQVALLCQSSYWSPELGPLAIQATIDKTPYTITEDLVRSHLQLADDGGIDDLPLAEIYSGMDNLGKLVKKVKAIEVKLKTKKRKMVVSDSDQEDGEKQDVDLDALRALANAAVTVNSNIPPGGASLIPAASISVPAAVPTGASTVPAGSPSVPADVPPSVSPAGVSNKGKPSMVEEDIPVKERTFKQMQEDILGEQAAKRLHDEEQPYRAELQRQRQQEVFDSAMYYTEADWINIFGRLEVRGCILFPMFMSWKLFLARVFNSPMLYLLRVKMVINSPWIMPILGTKELASPEQTAPSKDIKNPFMAVMIWQKSLGYSNSPMIHVLRVGLVTNSPGLIKSTHVAAVVSKSVAGLRFAEDSSMLLTFGIQCCWFEFQYADAAFSRDIPLNMYVVHTGRVVVPTIRYVVPASNVLTVSTGRLSLIPTGRVLSPGRIRIVVPG
nr:hypothetical protein [Tanacetum cinerariifolium]